ncbi:hypothetical protein HLB44_15820 [Aquincola sp. S2]|uniref:Uncharacterized protein n=1 Tax=Pseudaquabacterium terrae TaxID=2732868 RepID=A0ABX2EIJ0_9BURK|nr:hypothetical protein [Aquabacterium terrae]NRF68462.1 hypothetical protein [Aquabacterium terrae]
MGNPVSFSPSRVGTPTVSPQTTPSQPHFTPALPATGSPLQSLQRPAGAPPMQSASSRPRVALSALKPAANATPAFKPPTTQPPSEPEVSSQAPAEPGAEDVIKTMVEFVGQKMMEDMRDFEKEQLKEEDRKKEEKKAEEGEGV